MWMGIDTSPNPEVRVLAAAQGPSQQLQHGSSSETVCLASCDPALAGEHSPVVMLCWTVLWVKGLLALVWSATNRKQVDAS